MVAATIPGRKKKKHKIGSGRRAVESTTMYSFTVNWGEATDWSKVNDPNGLQQLAEPYLQAWKQDGTLKMQVCRAVLAYVAQLPDKETQRLEEIDRYRREQTQLLGESLIEYLQLNLERFVSPVAALQSTAYLQNVSLPPPVDDGETDSFLRKRLRYSND